MNKYRMRSHRLLKRKLKSEKFHSLNDKSKEKVLLWTSIQEQLQSLLTKVERFERVYNPNGLVGIIEEPDDSDSQEGGLSDDSTEDDEESLDRSKQEKQEEKVKEKSKKNKKIQ